MFLKNLPAHFRDFYRYRSLLFHLIERDFKVKYRRSVLGILWSLLSPLLMMLIMAAVFSSLFRFDIENFPVYLLSGQLIFNSFSEATNGAMSSMISASGFIRKVYIPKYIFPLEKAMFAFVNLLFSCLAIIGVMIFTGQPITLNTLFFPITFVFLFVFGLGVGLILASLAVFFRDVIHFYGVFLTAMMYLTPIMYPENILPPFLATAVRFSPIYWFISMFRNAVLYDLPPTVEQLLWCSISSVVALIIGLIVFKKSQDKFILYV